MIEELAFHDIDISKKNIVYGAGTIGEYVFYLLKQKNMEIFLYCDRMKKNQIFMGIQVISPEEILAYQENNILIAASGGQFVEIREYLQKNGVQKIYCIDELFKGVNLNRNLLSENARDYEYHIESFLWHEKKRKSDDIVYIESLDLVITQCCSMKCKNCCNLMQYYKNPQNFLYEDVIREFDRLLEVVDEVFDLYLIGGEPLVNKDIYQYIEYYEKNPKIKYINVFTNATILPDMDKIKKLNLQKLRFSVTDYGDKSIQFENLCESLEKSGVKKSIFRSDTWFDLGKLEEHDYTDELISKTYQECFCRALTFINGKLYCCPYSAHGRTLEAIPPKEDDEIVFKESVCIPQKKTELIQFIQEKKTDYACKYCNGKNLNIPVIPAAIQISEALPYRKYWE